jgi:selenocysteine-specific elongation factor
MRYVLMGTAGHIDHGKSALVKALTGIDPDRLKEEKQRGITIDLGFAHLEFPQEGLRVGIVDVPGHERLVRNMLAGAGGIDMVMLVVAADEGVMPQSREHLSICELLRIPVGLVAVSKTDLVEPDWLQLVMEDVRDFLRGSFLQDAPLVPVSAKTGQGLEELKEAIREVALRARAKPTGGIFRMPIDRVFTLRGFGTVVTGTALSGRLALEETVEVLPLGRTARVRGIQSHGQPQREALAGQRVALNLQGIEKAELSRGDVVVSPGRLRSTRALDVRLELLGDAPALRTGSVVRFHLGTSEAMARVVLYGIQELRAGESCYGQLRLSEPVVAQSQDRFVLRRPSPLQTIGGGLVLDAWPRRRRRAEPLQDLQVYEQGSLADRLQMKVLKAGQEGISAQALQGWIRAELRDIQEALQGLQAQGQLRALGGLYLHQEALRQAQEVLLRELGEFHRANPLKPGMAKEQLRALVGLSEKVFDEFLRLLASQVVAEREVVRLSTFRPSLGKAQEALREAVLKELAQRGFQPPDRAELAGRLKVPQEEITDMLRLLAKEGELVRINDSLYMHRKAYEEMLKRLREFFASKGELTVAEFRDLIGSSRKYALPILEHLDTQKITLRVGEVRKLLQRP